MAAPVSEKRLSQITFDACQSTLEGVTTYRHADTEAWNGQIIDKILKAVISESKETSPGYRFIVNSTIVQCLGDHASTGADKPADPSNQARVGMHCATGAYWNNEKDGMFSDKFTGVSAMDVVISIIWVSS